MIAVRSSTSLAFVATVNMFNANGQRRRRKKKKKNNKGDDSALGDGVRMYSPHHRITAAAILPPARTLIS